MNFWETEGASIQQSQIEDILNNRPTLIALFNETTFMDEFYSQKPKLVEYLAKPEIIRQMLEFIYDVDKMTTLTFKQQCDYPFIAFNVLSNMNPAITEALYKNNDLLLYFFSIENRNMDKYITSQGYFQAIAKNMLSDLNSHSEEFVKLLKADAEKRVFPLVRNLSRANAEVIKDILTSTKSYIKKLQNCIFEYLLFYFLNEQFKDGEDIREMFENLNDLFTFLRQEGVKYDYKLKYEYTLYSDKYVKNRKYKEEIYTFKLILLKYIAETKQIAKCDTPEVFIKAYKDFRSSEKFTFLVNSTLEFFRILARNEEFPSVANPAFIAELLVIVKTVAKNDIIHKHVFEILKCLNKYISTNQPSIDIIAEFLIEAKPKLRMPNQSDGFRNSISLHFIQNLINDINLDMVNSAAKQELKEWRDQLNTVFTKLCFDPSLSKMSNLDESCDVQIIVAENFRFIGDEHINENRDHTEDKILKPEPIDSATKTHVFFNINHREYKDYNNSNDDNINSPEIDFPLDNQLYSIEDISDSKTDNFVNKEHFGDRNTLKNDLFSPVKSKTHIFEFEERGSHSDLGPSKSFSKKLSGSQFNLDKGSRQKKDIFDLGGFDNQKAFEGFDEFK